MVRQLRGTAADLEEAAAAVPGAFGPFPFGSRGFCGQPRGGSGAGLGNLPNRWVDVGEVAAVLNCSARWVMALCQQGRLAATKRGRSWAID